MSTRLKDLILETLSRDGLRDLLRCFGARGGVEGPRLRQSSAALEALRIAGAEELLPRLAADVVREVARRYDVSATGSRTSVIERLVERESEERTLRSGVFVAIDFEGADTRPDSACAIGVVRVEGLEITSRLRRYIRPPREEFTCTRVHGITWEDVREAPTFAELWPELLGTFDAAEFIAAHNAGYDRKMLYTCCQHAGVVPPPLPFECTVRMARKHWKLRRVKLPDVCEHLAIPLRHHDPLSDAEASARIVIAARRVTLNRDFG